MKRSLFALACSLFLVSTTFAGEVVLPRETPLYERPSADAAVKATLPAGMRLELLTEQGDWLAVSSGALSGWIARAAMGEDAPAADEDADEIIRSIREIAGASDSTAAPPPAPVSAADRETPPPPPPSGGSAPSPSEEGMTPPPPPPPSGSGSGSSLPPPPPARPPSHRGRSTYGPTPPWGGFYNSRGWYRVTANLLEDETGGALDIAIGMGAPVKLGFVIGGASLDAKRPPKFEEMADALEEDAGGWLVIDRFETLEESFTAVDFEMYLDAFFAHPRPGRPIGVYGGVFFGYRQFLGLEDAYDGEFDDLTRQRWGGEVGLFHATQTSTRLIGRVSYRLMRESYLAGDASVDETVGLFLAGMELQVGAFVPGLFAGRTSTDETVLTFSLTLAPGAQP